MSLDRATIWPYDERGEPGEFYYQRYGSPTVAEAERAIGALEHGAQFALHSATKYLAGHDDVLLGAVVCRDEVVAERLRRFRSVTGIVAAPDPAWLLLRGLKTLELRVARQTASAGLLAQRL